MLYIVSYDIESDRTRTRLAKRLKDFGFRVQFSVFEADVDDRELEELKKVLSETELEARDSIRLYGLCQHCLKRVEIWGQGEVRVDKPYHIV